MCIMMLSYGAPAFHMPAPEGYFLRECRAQNEEDAQGWIHACVKLNEGVWTNEQFKKEMLDDPECGADHIFFICRESDGKIAGTAAAKMGEVAILHMVGMAEEFMGLGLSKIVCAYAMDYMRQHGFHRIQLSTNDFRKPAIKTYLNLGFRPWYNTAGAKESWRQVFMDMRLDPGEYFAYDELSWRKIEI